VLVLLEPGAAPVHTRGWAFVREHLTKPLRAEALLALLPGVRPPGTRPVPPGWPALSGAGAGAAGPLRGFEQLVAEMHLEPGLVRELVASFLERAPGYLDELSVCVTRGDLAGMERTAHTLKGMCGNLRFQHLVQLGETLRAAARGGDRAGIAHALEALRVELDTLYAALRERWMIEEE
jgi:HPt (histidine-containing phosphotransfer) domain-containing protein